MVSVQHHARRPCKDKWVTALVGHHEPIVVPILDGFATQPVPAIACLKLPQVSEAWQEIRIAMCLDCDVRWTDLPIKPFDGRRNRNGSRPVRTRLRPELAVQREQSFRYFSSYHRFTQAAERPSSAAAGHR